MKKLFKIIRYINNHPLAGRNRLKTYWKLLYWQVWQFIFRKENNVEFLQGVRMSVSKGMLGATGNIYTGLHEFNNMGFMLHLLRDTDLFFDIGSNVGSYTLLSSGVCGARTVAFEPSPDTFPALMKNIRLNQLETKVVAEQIALGADAGKTTFTASMDARNHVLPDWITDVPSIEVNVKTADSFLQTFGCPVLVKMDVKDSRWMCCLG